MVFDIMLPKACELVISALLHVKYEVIWAGQKCSVMIMKGRGPLGDQNSMAVQANTQPQDP
jgi:hypothetical protein